VRVVAVAEHRDIDEVSRRGILPDLGVDVRQIDSLINPGPDPVFAGIGNFRPRDRLRARDRSSLDSLLEEAGFEPSVPLGDRNRIAVRSSPVCARRPDSMWMPVPSLLL
jgi:hypothetical protein